MLPYFHIITPHSNTKQIKMQKGIVPQKPKRNKKPEVQVHRQEKKDGKIIKTFSANVGSKLNKHGDQLDDNDDSVDVTNEFQFRLEDPDDKLNNKLSRKILVKENEKLKIENKELIEKLSLLEEHLIKKNSKLREKNSALYTFNETVTNENNALRNQNEELITKLKNCQEEVNTLKNCMKCEDLTATLEKYKVDLASSKKLNSEMSEDLNMLKNVVFRLNCQLERYQDKLNKHNIRIHSYKERSDNFENTDVQGNELKGVLTESHWNHGHTPISWGKVNVHTLGPLLDAYQETIREKEEIIANYEDEFAKFTGRLKDIIKENELLHKRLTEDSGCSKVLTEQLELIKTELISTRKQNDLLIKKCALKQDKVEEVLKCYEQKIEQMRRDYAVLHEQYCKSRNEVSGLKEKNKALIDSQEDFRSERQQYIPISVHKSSVEECRKWYEELKQQYENEKLKLCTNISCMNKQIKELTENITKLNLEKSEMDNKVKLCEKQLKKAESRQLELEHNLNEIQLSRSACRKQLHKAMSFAKDLVGEQESLLRALNQRHLENKAVKKLGSDIASRMDSLKNQLKSVQRDAYQELSSVEQRLQEQDEVIENMKKEHELEVEKLKEIIRRRDDNILMKGNVSSIQIPHYLLFKDRNLK